MKFKECDCHNLVCQNMTKATANKRNRRQILGMEVHDWKADSFR